MLKRVALLALGLIGGCGPAAAQYYEEERDFYCNAPCRAWMGWDDFDDFEPPVIRLAPPRRAVAPAPKPKVARERPAPPREVKSKPPARQAAKPAPKKPVAKARPAPPAPAAVAAAPPPPRTVAKPEPPPVVAKQEPPPAVEPVAPPAVQEPQVAAAPAAPPEIVAPPEPPPPAREPDPVAAEPPPPAPQARARVEPAALPEGSAEIRRALGLEAARAFDTDLKVGDILDPSIELQELPAAFRTLRPYLASLRYTVIGDTAYLVYPETRRIVMTF